MLSEISIANLGVIPRASVELSSGLTVLTGETGAGKTMVVTGLRLLTGGRSDASRVRSGATEAIVEGSFQAAGVADETREEIERIIEEAGAEADENNEYLVARSVKSTGRSRAHLGGRSVPAAKLAELTSHLLTIHGQNDQLRLMSADQQLAALDRFSEDAGELVGSYRSAWKKWRAAAKDLRDRTERRRELTLEIDRLQFALKEIDDLAPTPDEDKELVGTINRLQDVDALREAAETSLIAIDGADSVGGYGDMDAAASLLGQASQALTSSSDSTLQELGERIEETIAVLGDVSGEISRFLSALPSDPEELDRLLHRQHELKALTKKYAPDIRGVLKWRDKAEERLQSIDTSDEAIGALKTKVAEAEALMKRRARALSKARRKAAKELAQAVTEELHGLAMPKAQLSVVVSETDFGADGADSVEILLAPNATFDPQPLATSASGGELSRVMLALEVILSSSAAGMTLVFDEVDAGVGGRAAVEIGRRLARLATRNQVIVVTHLPQVAAYADTHLRVAKDVSDEAVTSGVQALSEDERVEELARMMAGMEDSDTGRAHASELLRKAREEVQIMRA